MTSPYRIGTRKSPLALKQTDILVKSLQQAHAKDLRIQNPEIVGITTTGDCVQDKSLSEIGGKALFVKEIEQALFEKRIDFAVHSLKDVEANLCPDFQLACVLEREVVNDVLIEGALDAIVLAFAGLKRLDLFEDDAQLKGHPNLKSCLLSLEEMIPAVGQELKKSIRIELFGAMDDPEALGIRAGQEVLPIDVYVLLIWWLEGWSPRPKWEDTWAGA
eukprot:gene16052-16221_t